MLHRLLNLTIPASSIASLIISKVATIAKMPGQTKRVKVYKSNSSTNREKKYLTEINQRQKSNEIENKQTKEGS